MNYLGQVFASIVYILESKSGVNWDLCRRICMFIGIFITSVVQIVLLLKRFKQEPIRYLNEKFGNLYVNQICEKKENLKGILESLRKACLHKKFFNMGCMSTFSEHYQKATCICLGLLLIKAENYLIMFPNRLPRGNYVTYEIVNNLIKVLFTSASMIFLTKVQHKSIILYGFYIHLSGNLLISVF